MHQSRAQAGAVALGQCVVENGRGQAVMFDGELGVLQGVGRSQVSASSLEGVAVVQGDEGFVFNNENAATLEMWAWHGPDTLRGKAQVTRGRAACKWPQMTQAPDNPCAATG